MVGPRFRNPAARQLMRATLAIDPSVRESLLRFLRMGAYDIRPDYILLVKPTGCDRVSDPGAWNANLDAFGKINSMGVCMLRSRDGTWFFVEC